MKLWSTLYLVTWIVFLEFLLGTWPNPPAVVPYLHLLLGLGIVALTYNSFRRLREARVPGRLKRIARATYALSWLMVVLGFLLWFNVGSTWTLPLIGYTVFRAILVFHIVNALAIITQAAALALGYDMWEDREFEKGTEPGEVPAMPTPQQ
jgi:vacuolar-type H+-ATPase subunit I/STV1